jgi:hypothetical protein
MGKARENSKENDVEQRVKAGPNFRKMDGLHITDEK